MIMGLSLMPYFNDLATVLLRKPVLRRSLMDRPLSFSRPRLKCDIEFLCESGFFVLFVLYYPDYPSVEDL